LGPFNKTLFPHGVGLHKPRGVLGGPFKNFLFGHFSHRFYTPENPGNPAVYPNGLGGPQRKKAPGPWGSLTPLVPEEHWICLPFVAPKFFWKGEAKKFAFGPEEKEEGDSIPRWRREGYLMVPRGLERPEKRPFRERAPFRGSPKNFGGPWLGVFPFKTGGTRSRGVKSWFPPVAVLPERPKKEPGGESAVSSLTGGETKTFFSLCETGGGLSPPTTESRLQRFLFPEIQRGEKKILPRRPLWGRFNDMCPPPASRVETGVFLAPSAR